MTKSESSGVLKGKMRFNINRILIRTSPFSRVSCAHHQDAMSGDEDTVWFEAAML